MTTPTPSIFPLSSRALDCLEEKLRIMRNDLIEKPRDGWSVAREITDLIHDARMAEFRAGTDRRAARAKKQLITIRG